MNVRLALRRCVSGVPVAAMLAGCNERQGNTPLCGAAVAEMPQHGKELIQGYGCGACHMVPGVHGARGLVGPPLFYLQSAHHDRR